MKGKREGKGEGNLQWMGGGKEERKLKETGRYAGLEVGTERGREGENEG